MKFQTKKEWQEYLITQIKKSNGGYAVVKYEEKPELLYFAKHNYKGELWVLEAPNFLRRFKITSEEDKKQWVEDGYLIKNDYAYEIETPQCSPFLPEEIEILEVIGSSEGKALDYLLKYDYKDTKWQD